MKDQTINVKTDDTEKEILQKASKIKSIPVSTFLRMNGLELANKIIQENK